MTNKNQNHDGLEGLGPKSIKCLNEAGIYTRSDLERIGPIQAFLEVKAKCTSMKPSLNLLYGLVAIIEGVHWREVAKKEKGRLLMELEGAQMLAFILKEKTDK